MSELPQRDHAPTALGGADPTRDIRLPPLPDRPPAAMPRAWAVMPPKESAATPDASTPDAATPDAENPDPSSPDDSRPDDSRLDLAALPAQPRPTVLPDEPTDVLAPPHGRPRERTLSFASPEAAPGRPMPKVGRTPRRWPWVVMALLPVLVIVISGIWWYLLLRAA
jgi:hypothetical protein